MNNDMSVRVISKEEAKKLSFTTMRVDTTRSSEEYPIYADDDFILLPIPISDTYGRVFVRYARISKEDLTPMIRSIERLNNNEEDKQHDRE